MADPFAESAALADLRALLPMVRHHVAMLSSPATVGQNANAGRELAELADTMAALCMDCGMTDCAQLLDTLHAALAQAPVATSWSPRFAAVALEAFGYTLHRIGALGGAAASSPDMSAQEATVSQLMLALEAARQPEAKEAPATFQPMWSDERETLADVADVFTDDDAFFSDGVPTEPADLTDDERKMLASFPSASLRVTMPPAPQLLTPDSPAASLPGAALAGSGWAPGPTDVLPDEPDEPDIAPEQDIASEPEQAAAEQTTWRLPTASELDEIPEEMKHLFLVETEEDLQDLRLALLRYEQRPDDPSALHAIGRITHKIKGTAATLGFDVLAAVTHHYEDFINALLMRRVEAGVQANAVLLRGLVLLQSSLDASNAGQTPDPALAAEAATLLNGLPSTGNAAHSTHARTPLAMGPFGAPAQASSGGRESTAPMPRSDEGEASLRVDVHRLDDLMRHLSALAVNRAALLQTRDDVVRLQTDMDAALARLGDLGAQMSDLQPLLQHVSGRSLERSARRGQGADATAGLGVSGALENSAPRHTGPLRSASQASVPVWDELELDSFTEFDSALRALGEVVADITASSRDLRAALLRLGRVSEEQAGLASRMQRDVMHVRLVPLSDIVPRLDFEVKVLAGLARKSIAFSVSGEMTEIDRNISEALREPLVQLVRNAVVHGIESPEERAESGKPTTGTVWVHAYYVGSEVIIEVGDDGRGVNPHKVTASAVAAGLLEGEAARVLSPAEALDLMFWPGVTTFDGARAVSGRGIGLDEVRTAIQKLKGVISVRSELGKGSIFRVRVPISLSIVHALRVLAGDQSFAVPFTSVKRTLNLTASEILASMPTASDISSAPDGGSDGYAARPSLRIRVEREGELSVAHGDGASQANQAYEEIPAFALATLLGLEHVPRDPQPALLVEVGRQRVALLVDGVFEEQEAAVQTLSRPLRRRAVRGASVTPDGQVLLLLDLPELVAGTLDGSQAIPPPRPRPVPRFAETLAPRVLVVDDSVTIRQTLEHILQRGGFEVQQARDGIEALEKMLVSLPRVVVLDIEMPRLDGFEMLSILHGSPQFSDVPVVMLTSRAAEKHKEHALKLGARGYLIKPCPQETLLETVRGLLAEPVSGNA